MPSFECKFNIGDLVLTKSQAIDWALSEQEKTPTTRQVCKVLITDEGTFVSADCWARFYPQEDIIFASDLKSFAINQITQRLQNEVSLGDNGESIS